MEIGDLIKNFDRGILTAECPIQELQNFLYKNLKKDIKNDFVCAICQDEIEQFNEICKPKCTCKLWYHISCLTKAYKDTKQSGQCLQCRKNVTILNWETSLKKYWISNLNWKQLYLKIYSQLSKANLYWEKLVLTMVFFQEVKVYREKYPNYILLPLFDFRNFLKFDLADHLRKFSDVFNNNLKIGDKKKMNRIFAIPPLYKTGEPTIVDENTFRQKFREFTYDIIDDNFEWNNIFLAGGSLFRLTSPKFINKIPDTSDLDFFIYGEDAAKRNQTLNRILEYFKGRFGDEVFFVAHPYRGMVELYFKGIARYAQLICNAAKSPIEILEKFDLEHVQLCYFNNKLYSTPNCMLSLRNQISFQGGSKIIKHRIKKGLTFHQSLVLNVSSINYNKYLTGDANGGDDINENNVGGNNVGNESGVENAENHSVTAIMVGEDGYEHGDEHGDDPGDEHGYEQGGYVDGDEHLHGYVDGDEHLHGYVDGDDLEMNLKDIKKELKDLKCQELFPNNIKDYSEHLKILPNKFFEYHNQDNSLKKSFAVGDHISKSKTNTYYPKFEETNDDIIQILRKRNSTVKNLIVTQDPKLILDKIKFINREESEAFYY